MRIAITGAQGQLGLALQRALYDDDVIPYSHEELDITDADRVAQVVQDRRPDAVIHAAAWTDTTGCEEDPGRAIEVNGRGAGNVAKACARTGAVMLYVSSNEVFDGETNEPYAEDAQTNPVNHYGRSKLEGEKQVRDALERHQLVRTSWLYGPGRVSFPEKIIKAAREQGRLKLVTDEIASPTWTIDLASALAALVRMEEFGVFHLTNAGYCSRKVWAEEILRIARLGSMPTESATMADFGGATRKPPFTALANVRAAKLGITMRNWRQALLDHFKTAVRSP